MEKQYFEMLKMVEDYNLAFKEGYFTEEQLNTALKQIEILKVNYERLSNIMYLFNKPRRDSKRKKFDSKTFLLSDHYSTLYADKKSVIDENTNVLKYLQDELKKVKKNDK